MAARGRLWRRAGSCRDLPAKRPSRFSSRRIPRCSLRSVVALPFSTFPATCLAKPPPQRRDEPRTPFCILGVMSDFSTRAVNLWHDPVTAHHPAGLSSSGTPTGPSKHPRALPKRDSGIDGTMRRPVAAVEARRSRPLAWPMTVAVIEGWVGKEGVPNPWSVPSKGNLCGFPSAIFFAQIYESARDPNIPTGGTIRDSCYKLCYKRDRGRQSSMVIYQWFNEL
jgi:hypothetical protein